MSLQSIYTTSLLILLYGVAFFQQMGLTQTGLAQEEHTMVYFQGLEL